MLFYHWPLVIDCSNAKQKIYVLLIQPCTVKVDYLRYDFTFIQLEYYGIKSKFNIRILCNISSVKKTWLFTDLLSLQERLFIYNHVIEILQSEQLIRYNNIAQFLHSYLISSTVHFIWKWLNILIYRWSVLIKFKCIQIACIWLTYDMTMTDIFYTCRRLSLSSKLIVIVSYKGLFCHHSLLFLMFIYFWVVCWNAHMSLSEMKSA